MARREHPRERGRVRAGNELLPPRRTPTARARRAPRQRVLSREVIVEAVLRVVDADGVGAVTMRRVAEELDTGGASLYAHFSDKEELLELAYDRVLGDVPLIERPDPKRWQEQIKELLRNFRATLLQHRDLARIGLGRVPTGPYALRGMESMLAVLRAGPLPDSMISYAADVLSAYVVTSAFESSLFIERAAGEPEGAFERELEEFFTGLPREEFPNVVAMAAALVGEPDDGELRFEFGLDVIVRGLAARAKR